VLIYPKIQEEDGVEEYILSIFLRFGKMKIDSRDAEKRN